VLVVEDLHWCDMSTLELLGNRTTRSTLPNAGESIDRQVDGRFHPDGQPKREVTGSLHSGGQRRKHGPGNVEPDRRFANNAAGISDFSIVSTKSMNSRAGGLSSWLSAGGRVPTAHSEHTDCDHEDGHQRQAGAADCRRGGYSRGSVRPTGTIDTRSLAWAGVVVAAL
jgi:hypothetical protein